LLEQILKHTGGLNSIYCYVEDKHSGVKSVWEKLGFTIWRYSWILSKDTGDITASGFPEGFELRTFRDGVDEDVWCGIINESFANMLGHTTMRPEKIEEWRKEPSYIPGGMKLLWHGEKPVATAAMIKETDNGEESIFIEAVGVLNDYQGRGLGRNILRAGVEFAKDFGVKKAMLSVNAENEKAVQLYLNEGFKKEELYICYRYHIKQKR
jgi:mycothiol synthase